MCNFFSFVTEPECHGGRKYYFNVDQRESPSCEGDSHSSICKNYGLNEDKCNKYEYSPFTGTFTVDQINSEVDDRVQAEEWVRSLEFMGNIIRDRHLYSVGDRYKFKNLSWLHKHHADVLAYWSMGMDYLPKEYKDGIVLTKEMILQVYREKFFRLPGTHWLISMDMMEKKGTKINKFSNSLLEKFKGT